MLGVGLLCFVGFLGALSAQEFVSDAMDVDFVARMSKALDLEGDRAFYVEDMLWERAANAELDVENIAQAVGVAVDSQGLVYLLHRGPNVWNAESFNANNEYVNGAKDTIRGSPIRVMHPGTGDNMPVNVAINNTVMPHGLHIDAEDNIWITDVALHQVMMFNASAKDNAKPSLVLGEAFKPGSGPKHFCKPTDVVRRKDLVFISDGYCNSRVVVYTTNGTFVKEFGRPMAVVHSITISEETDLVCVTDRENGKIHCFSAGINNSSTLGEFRFTIQRLEGERVFSAKAKSVIVVGASIVPQAHGTETGIVFVQELSPEGDPKAAITFTPELGRLVQPHSVALTDDLQAIFVVDSAPNMPVKIYKFLLHQ